MIDDTAIPRLIHDAEAISADRTMRRFDGGTLRLDALVAYPADKLPLTGEAGQIVRMPGRYSESFFRISGVLGREPGADGEVYLSARRLPSLADVAVPLSRLELVANFTHEIADLLSAQERLDASGPHDAPGRAR